MTWRHTDLWKRAANTFAVEVSRHEGLADSERGPNRWCVYAYLYPTHPRFDAVITRKLSDDGVTDLPLHGGCTFNHWHNDRLGQVASKQIGADYDHCGDEFYTHLDTQKSAWIVFADADRLFDMLESEVSR